MVDPTVILAGAIPAAVLALSLDGGLTLAERCGPRAAQRRPAQHDRGRPLVVVAARRWPWPRGRSSPDCDPRHRFASGRRTSPSRSFSARLLAQTLEARGIAVERRLNLGGTFICDRAIRAGDIDVYVEYTGTALTAILRQPPVTDARRVLDDVRRRYADAGLTVLDPLGFENTFAILVRAADAERLRLKTIADAAGPAAGWQAGFGYEFLQREDGYPGLAKTYGLTFRAPPRAMDLSLIYRALADGQVDLVAGDATSGLIDAYGLVMLEDNRRYFPPYDAVAVARSATLLAHPEVHATPWRRLAAR